ncbi:hypothetical protein [Brevibacillus sp. SYSU BS000544]|uniref:hypothetical protein n=1 Tax=Brevibacillus sp. SYSU BS000544 TaxID=3416443 RepID=UPI003CE467E9
MRTTDGWFVITVSYFVVLFCSSWTYMGIIGLPIDQHRDVSGLVLGSVMVVVPYVIGGLFAARSQEYPIEKAAFWMSLVPALSEKILIFLIGAFFVATGGDGGGDGIVTWKAVMMFVSAEAVPYFTNMYLLTFPLSVLVCVGTAKLFNRKNIRAHYSDRTRP